ncbi:E3 ubiquitin-protein ligase TRIM21-like isoform X6 [Scophthalmus maximus]|uniref:E3 ubiquitin-protein ligase TRIM21-like isoform X6 n=1 Tax=Scophthalmus maximus TaxID=52904 RepID=UPI001FA8E606|nr:E3 ubiquitin-protein ligase TRIM21-like isoform X6 [Scophthalmus maximus]
MSLQVCHCGWNKVTSYQGLRIHQGKKGCTPRGARVPEGERLVAPPPHITFMSPALINLQEPVMTSSDWSSWRELGSELRDVSRPVQQNVPASPNLFSQMRPAATEASLMDMIRSLVEEPHFSVELRASSDATQQAFDFHTAAQPLFSQTLGNQIHPAAADGTATDTNKPHFQTPPQFHQTVSRSDKTRRALDFNTAAEAKQARRRAEVQQRIQIRELKMAEVRLSVKTCKLSLDAEWLQINAAFSEVMSVVEDARQKALRPLEKRRGDVKRQAHDLVQRLEREINQLQTTMDELDRNPALQVTTRRPDDTGTFFSLDSFQSDNVTFKITQISREESADWKNERVDTSLSFGTLRTTTSAMMEQIHLRLEKLSSVELKRIPTFAVDVKLNPTTAHQCLVLSDDGKKVRDGAKTQKVPDTPERFDEFGSVLGVNSLTSGRSYWEVEVSNKSGWDLGVARADANRKGKLSLSPDDGYWVIVHYEDERYAALTAPPVCLSLRGKPQKVGVFVDRQEGLVSLYDVTARSHVFSFTECSFRGEIFPYFSPHLEKNGTNSAPLIISAVKRK